MYGENAEWGYKGATLSEKTACKEFGLTQEEIEKAIRAGKLQYRMAAAHGHPFLRLLRRELEALVAAQHGHGFLRDRQLHTELKLIERKLKQLRAEVAALEDRKKALKDGLEEPAPYPPPQSSPPKRIWVKTR